MTAAVDTAGEAVPWSPKPPSDDDWRRWDLEPQWSRFVDVVSHTGGTHRWHVLDTGVPEGADASSTPTVLCVHGNPTWGYAWATFLRRLHGRYRVVAVDQLGMGFSDRVERRRYTDRVRDLDDVIVALGLPGASPLVVAAHDWGGAIVMGWVVQDPRQVAGLILCNTGIAVPEGRKAPSIIRLAAWAPILDFVCRGTSIFVEGTSRLSRGRISKVDREAFRAPYPTAPSRAAIADFVDDIPLSPGHPSETVIAEVAERLGNVRAPVLLAWGAKDPVFNDDFAADLAARFPNTTTHRFAKAGHLVMAEADVAGVVDVWLGDLFDGRLASVPGDGPAPGEPTAEASVWSAILSGRDGGREAFVDLATGDSITFAELAQRVERVAVELVRRGVQPGDRVAMLTPPGVDLVAAVYGVWRAGGVTVIADLGLGLQGLGRAVRSTRPAWVIGPKRALAASTALRWAPRATRLDVADLLVGAAGELPPEPSGDDVAAVLFTSGATGPAKGVRYLHRQLVAQRDALAATYSITADDRLVAAFAPFALYGPALGIPTALPNCDVTKPAELTAAMLDEACARIGATLAFASPSALANVVATADGSPLAGLEALRVVFSAGAPVPSETLEAVGRLAPNASLHTPYGMTEVLPVADIELGEIVAAEAAAPDGGVCVGRPVSGAQVRIVPLDFDAAELPDAVAVGVMGEILVRAPWVSEGYLGLWATQRAARPGAGEWHRSGDVGHVDADGRLWVEGRAVHVIHGIDGPITPVPVERAVQRALGVPRCAAVGVGPVGSQQLVVVLEEPEGVAGAAGAEVADEVRAAVGRPVAAVLTAPSLPVDIRHNAKIDRAAVAQWADGVLAGRRVRNSRDSDAGPAMKVLVTGGSSLIGAGVANALASRGDDVVCLQRSRSALVDAGVAQHLGDIREREVVVEAASGCDAVVHVAAKVGVIGPWEEYRSVNVDGTANVVAAARERGVPRVVYVSSPSVAHGGEPIVGGAADAPVLGRRRAWYPESKAMAEIVALDAASGDMGVVAVRPHLVWGPGDTQLVGRIVERARAGRLALVGGGRALVDTTYLDNAVAALVAALDAVHPGARCSGRAYVVSNGEPRMIRELVEGICSAARVTFAPRDVSLRVGRSAGAVVERVWPILRRSDEPPLTQFLAEQLGTAHWFDSRPARDDLGYSPAVSIDEGLRRLGAWFDEQAARGSTA